MTQYGPSLDRAYATLGVAAGSSRAAVVHQYRRLVRRWHPDRFVRDPERHAEATRRMQDINLAFELVIDAIEADVRDSTLQPKIAPVSVGMPEQHMGRRLTKEEIDAIAKAIGEPGVLPFLGRCFALMGSVGAAFLLLIYGSRRGYQMPRLPEVIVALLLLGAAGVSVIRSLLRRLEW